MAEKTQKAYVGVREKDLRMTTKQTKFYETWKHRFVETFLDEVDTERIDGESTLDYANRIHCEKTMSDYLLLKCVVKYVIEEFGRIDEDEIFSWVENVGGRHFIVSNCGRVFRTMLWRSTWRSSIIYDKKGNIRGVFQLKPHCREEQITVTSFCELKGFHTVYKDNGIRWQRKFRLADMLRESFTVEQLEKHFGREKAEWYCTNGRRESTYKKTMTVKDLETGEVLVFKSKTAWGKAYGVSGEAVMMAISRAKKKGTEEVNVGGKKFIVIEDFKREGKNVNTQFSHSPRGRTKKLAKKKKEEKDFLRKFKNDNKKVIKMLKEMRAWDEKITKLGIEKLGDGEAFLAVCKQFKNEEKVKREDVRYVLANVWFGHCTYSANVGISADQWWERFCNMVIDVCDEVRQERRKRKAHEEYVKSLRRKYGRKAWIEKQRIKSTFDPSEIPDEMLNNAKNKHAMFLVEEVLNENNPPK